MDALAYITEHAEGRLIPSLGHTPEGRQPTDTVSPVPPAGPSVRVRGSDRVEGGLRLLVEVLKHSP